jgi:hypothetical protein
MTPDDRLMILALYAQYNRAIDAGDALPWARTFLEEGVFLHPAATYRGIAELIRFVTERQSKLGDHSVGEQRHWNDNIILEGSNDQASGSCDLLVAGRNRQTGRPEVVARGRYTDRLTATAQGWRFVERRLQIE